MTTMMMNVKLLFSSTNAVYKSVLRIFIPETISKERVAKFFFTPSECWIYKYMAPSTLRMNWGEKFLSTIFLTFLGNLHLPLVFATKR